MLAIPIYIWGMVFRNVVNVLMDEILRCSVVYMML